MAGLSKKDVARLIDHVEPQGVKVTPIKDGVLFRMPDGVTTTTVHYTGSDHRGPLNLRAQLRRAGISWPTDGGHRQKSQPSKQSRELGDAAMNRLGWPEETTSAQVMAAWDGDPTYSVVGRYLTYAGYDSVGHAKGARWIRYTVPERYLTAGEDPEDTGQDQATAAVARVTLATGFIGGDLEFLDTRDSWALDMASLVDVPVGHVQAVLDAVGMSMELRVWKTPE